MTSTREFLGLRRASTDRPSGDPAEAAAGTWTLPLEDHTGGGRGSLFGGVGLAVAVAALEDAGGKAAVWTTAQFAARTAPGSVLSVQADFPGMGSSVGQGRVVGHVGDVETLNALGSVGQRREEHRGVWATMPDARPPEDSEPVVHPAGLFGEEVPTGNIHTHVDARMAHGMFGFIGTGTPSGDHRSLIWARMPGVGLDAVSIALMSDYSPSVVGNALGEVVHCASLDNMIRFATPTDAGAADEWILLENELDHIGNGFAHTSCRVWSGDGQLLAVAGQSVSVFAAPVGEG